MKDNSNLWVGLLIGAAAGAALAMLVSSDEGQEVLEDIKSAAKKAEKDIKKAYSQFEETLSKSKDLAGHYEKKASKFIKQRTS